MEAENLSPLAVSQPAESTHPEDPWAAVFGLPCQLSVALSVGGFKVSDLLALDVEAVIDSRMNATGPVPVWVNGAKIGMAEFDVLGTRLAIRIKELG